jgi:hypothetical protein
MESVCFGDEVLLLSTDRSEINRQIGTAKTEPARVRFRAA